MKNFYKWSLLFIPLASNTCADDAVSLSAEEVVVTAKRVPEKLENTIQPTTLITADDIAKSGQETLVEVLQSLGGVEVASTGGFGQPSSVFIRGANSDHTLVLIDGLRVDSATTGTTAFENIPLNQIERIEIVPGPLSSLYGADAIGGVVQVFTKSSRYTPGVSASVGYGTFDTRTVSGGINERFHDTDFSFNAGYLISGGFDATKSSIDAPGTPSAFLIHNPDLDDYHNTNYSLRLAQHFTTDHRFKVTGSPDLTPARLPMTSTGKL